MSSRRKPLRSSKRCSRISSSIRQQVVRTRAISRVACRRASHRHLSGGTDNHLFLLDLIERNIAGKDADAALGRANITVNKNAVPNDPVHRW